jgi:serine/threonine protein kinase
MAASNLDLAGGCDLPKIAPGSRLGRYEVESLIGKGGMGEVYRARDALLNRAVALKVLIPNLVLDRDNLARFRLEAQTMALLSHPNIVAIYDVGTHDGLPFIVSELLEGTTLRERLCRGPIGVDEAVTYALEMARGLIAADCVDVVHRDLKPENVFITTQNRVKILDFGLAKSPELRALASRDTWVSTKRGLLFGTVGYMAPEQVDGEPADHRSDIFSLGVILYEMLAGKPPFRGESPVETLYAIAKHDPAPLRDRRRGVSAELDRVVTRCLEKRPDARFQSARDLAFALERAGCSTRRPAADASSQAAGLFRTLLHLF